jgi:hypothetical protein
MTVLGEPEDVVSAIEALGTIPARKRKRLEIR